MRDPGGWPRRALDLGAALLLLLVPVIGFGPTFEGLSSLPAAAGGLVLGLAIATAGAIRRWSVLLVAAVVVAAYFVFGGALALGHTAIGGVVPTLETLRQLAAGVITAWKSLLTSVAPVAAEDGHLIVPFILSLVFATVTASLALRVEQAAWTLVPAGAFLVLQIALGTVDPAAPLVQGALFAVAAVAWLSVRAALAPEQGAAVAATPEEGGGADGRYALVRRLAAGGAVLAVAVGAGAVSLAATPADETRAVLREVIIPPFDVRQYPSPLQSFRKYVRDYDEDPLLTVTGLPAGARVRLATMDAYTGVVYDVAESSSDFTPLRSNMAEGAEGQQATIGFEIEGYEGPWLPDAGAVDSIAFTGDRGDDLRRGAYYNDRTDTAVVRDGLREGDAYTIDTVLPTATADTVAADDVFADVEIPTAEDVPGDLAEIAADAVVAATTPIDTVLALEAFLSESGAFSHGLEGEVVSRAGHGSQRIAALVGATQMVGDDEQYAVAMALMAGELGIPARVVMGFHPDEDAAASDPYLVTGEDVHAWVEVAFRGAGWVAFDPTPPEDQVPNDQTTKPRSDPKPQVLQPPPPPQEPAELPPLVPDERKTDDPEEPDDGSLAIVLVAGGIGLGTILVLLSPLIVIGALKAARRRRRRQAEKASDRISGGWDELRDRAVDFRAFPVDAPRGRTRVEEAAVLTEALDDTRVDALAVRADAEVFGPGDPRPDDVEAFWAEVDALVGGMKGGSSPWRRLRARLSLRSLRRPGGWQDRIRARRAARARGRKDG
ncbi:transglutaminase-like domain-containing protein [Microbacterium gilvum]|uniref:Transglutaminase-like domain-containing protein n=2 Tax=Microbacterium gilvum TaxID=1336204 RepID=A0ABP9A5F0_9MICO